MKKRRILFVCTGNTCRSPMAETIMRDIIKSSGIKRWDVFSRGIHAEDTPGMSASALAVLKEAGLDGRKFRPAQLTGADIKKSVFVICMTGSQKAVAERYGNAMCISEICGREIPDPYGQGMEAYRETRDALFGACAKIKDMIETYDRETEKT